MPRPGESTIRPALRRVALATVWPLRPGVCYATMSVGQWDGLLAGAYDAGWVLIELDDNENLVAAYRTSPVEWN